MKTTTKTKKAKKVATVDAALLAQGETMFGGDL